MNKHTLRQVKIGRCILKNPIMTASGTFGYGEEFEKFFDINILGGIVTKTVTLFPREGNRSPRIIDLGFGVLNSIGLENPGVQEIKKRYRKFFSSLKTSIFISIYGEHLKEWQEIINSLKKEKITGFELNFSCPNLKGNILAYSKRKIAKIISSLRPLTKKPLIAKLSFCPQITEIALSAQQAGADAVTLINSIPALAFDSKGGHFILGNISGGLSGPCIKPIALKCVYETSKKIKIPVIGCGGITNCTDVVEFLKCGAQAVQLGTINLSLPDIAKKIIKELSH